jgi:hypothetical protein
MPPPVPENPAGRAGALRGIGLARRLSREGVPEDRNRSDESRGAGAVSDPCANLGRPVDPLFRRIWGAALLRGITPEKQAVPLPEIAIQATGNRYRFLPGGKGVVFVPMRIGRENKSRDYFLLDLPSGRTRQLTRLRPDFIMRSFDVSPDGKTILFDRYRENADVVLIDLQR